MEREGWIVSGVVLFALLAAGLYACELAGRTSRGCGLGLGDRGELEPARPPWHPTPGDAIDRWIVVGSYGPNRRVRVTNWSPLWIEQLEGAFHCGQEQVLIGPFPPYTTVGEDSHQLGRAPCARARWHTSSSRTGRRPGGP